MIGSVGDVVLGMANMIYLSYFRLLVTPLDMFTRCMGETSWTFFE